MSYAGCMRDLVLPTYGDRLNNGCLQKGHKVNLWFLYSTQLSEMYTANYLFPWHKEGL